MSQKLTRVIVTTDMEVDDMNSLVHLALYLNLLDVQAVVYTASQYHFLGDGVHTLGEVNSHWRTKGRRSYEWAVVPHEPDPLAGELREYRPFPEHWIESLWSNEYAQAWPQLQANAAAAGEPPFPTPAQMIERTFVGNVAFEGDVTEETEGSRVIALAILDDDPRTLWLLSWGGMNTIVRALMSIAERYRATPEWPAVQQRVYQKVRVMGVTDGVGQDNSWLDHGRELFPELVFWRVPYRYGGYIDAKMAQPDTLPLFKAPWPEQNLTQGNGPLMARYMLYGDGTVYENEPERFQFGKHARLDWGLEGMPAMQFERGDFMAEGDSMTYIPLLPFGLRGIDDRGFDTLLGRLFVDGHPDTEAPAGFAAIGTPVDDNPNPYLRAYQEDFAARAQWCAHDPAACSHPAHVVETTADRSATAGERVDLTATIVDPDGKGFDVHWDVAVDPSSYAGAQDLSLWQECTVDTAFIVPADARPGDRLVLTLTVQTHAERPCTRYAQVAVTVAQQGQRPHSTKSVPKCQTSGDFWTPKQREWTISHFEPTSRPKMGDYPLSFCEHSLGTYLNE